ncbi:hypothetical protein DESPIG_02185 [Desulfovibrio piger ATCC 29098]|uniref:Lipoprotein n=1 Tax=Desulfovibrio piger ATCC 29098 TaxID=411464 RepID=B6WVR7_9BACT|nr:hypothetical protein DESPIG_02185 [Desulfovibrio piger ATCC 29098]
MSGKVPNYRIEIIPLFGLVVLPCCLSAGCRFPGPSPDLFPEQGIS